MSNSDAPITLLMFGVVIYILMQTGLLGEPAAAKSTAVTEACPRGKFYRMGIGEWLSLSVWGCDPGYTMTGVGVCTCQTPSSIPEAANSPQTPAPKPDYCPYDVNILAGDSRCVPERVYNYVPRIPTCPEGTYPTWYGGCEAGGGHL